MSEKIEPALTAREVDLWMENVSKPITQGDVRILRGSADEIECKIGKPLCDALRLESNERMQVRWLRSLADRIEALLPPDK